MPNFKTNSNRASRVSKQEAQQRKIHAIRRNLQRYQQRTFRRNPYRNYVRLFQEFLAREM